MKQKWFVSWFFYRESDGAKVEGYNTFDEDSSLNGDEVHDNFISKLANKEKVASNKIILIAFNKI